MMHLKKDPITESDLVLIHIENKPAFYGRVEKVSSDVKPNWWRVKFLFLTLPFQVVTWIIDEEQIRGSDFTMGGTPIRIEKVVVTQDDDDASEQNEEAQSIEQLEDKPRKARVLSLGEKKKE